jgi:5-methyltetrahydropteroyltriglutamate--homocysteine methyltransferase
VQEQEVEEPEKIIERIETLDWLSPEQTLITSSCGLNHLPRNIAFGKLKAMVDAEKMLRG